MEIQQNSKKNMVEHKKVRKKDLKFNEIYDKYYIARLIQEKGA